MVTKALQKAANGAGVRVLPPGERWPELLRGGGAAELAAAAACEATEHGMIALSDRAGCGPLYWCVLEVGG